MLFSSHINSLPVHLNLLDKTSCQLLVSASGVQVSDILAHRSMMHVIIPEFDHLFTATSARHYLVCQEFPAGRLGRSFAEPDPICIYSNRSRIENLRNLRCLLLHLLRSLIRIKKIYPSHFQSGNLIRRSIFIRQCCLRLALPVLRVNVATYPCFKTALIFAPVD